jgi:hypothetical protein
VAVLAGDQELTPNEAAAILGMSRPLVVHRMEIRDLPFRDVAKHRRVKLKDVLALKQRIDETQAAVDALAEGTWYARMAYDPPLRSMTPASLYPFHLRNLLIQCAVDGRRRALDCRYP